MYYDTCVKCGEKIYKDDSHYCEPKKTNYAKYKEKFQHRCLLAGFTYKQVEFLFEEFMTQKYG